MKQYTILSQKTKSSSPMRDFERDFSIVCLGIDMPEVEMKDIPSRDWGDEDGEDVFIPDTMREKGYEFSISVGYKGHVNAWEDSIDTFMDYLTGHDGSGSEVLLYIPHFHMGRKCRLIKLPSPTPSVGNGEIILEFTLTMRVDNPRSRVTANTGGTGTVVSLMEKKR